MSRGQPAAGADPATDAGVVRVLPAGTMQGVSIEDHLEAAAAARFDAVSLRPRHVRAWTAEGGGRSPERLASRLRGLSLGVAELDPLLGWSDPRQWPGTALPDPVGADLDLAAGLGARAVTALVAPGEGWETGPGIEGLAALCSAAAERALLVQLEPFGWSALGTVEVAARAVRATGAQNAGLMVDTWHLTRAGGGVSTVDRLAVGEVLALQVADGAVRPEHADPAEDNRRGRRWPGDGEQHPEHILASLSARGWAGPVAVEVFGDATPDPVGRARRAAHSLDRLGI